MVNKNLCITIALVLSAGFINAECSCNWVCTEWGPCSSLGYNTRDCIDTNNCDVEQNKPVEIKRCSDTNSYGTGDMENEELASADNTDYNDAGQIHDKDKEEPVVTGYSATEGKKMPLLSVGLLIILAFIILGILIGRKIRKKKHQ